MPDPPSESVAPAPSAAEKRIAELEAELYRLRNLCDPDTDQWRRISVVLMGITASPGAQGKEPRK